MVSERAALGNGERDALIGFVLLMVLWDTTMASSSSHRKAAAAVLLPLRHQVDE